MNSDTFAMHPDAYARMRLLSQMLEDSARRSGSRTTGNGSSESVRTDESGEDHPIDVRTDGS